MSIRGFTLLCLVMIGITSTGFAGTKLLRFPDIHEDHVVFCYGGDLWKASTKGGVATRLTAHEGLEVFPKFSPDGGKIAFTGQYEGDEQVYVVSSVGGEPQQLTYYPAMGPLPDRWGFDNQVYGWNPDGTAVLFRSMRHGWSLTDTRLYAAPLAGGLPTQLPMRVSGAGDYSPDGKQVVFSPLTRDFRTWKRYEGGWAQDLYTLDLQSFATKQITDNDRTDRDPMWIGDRIYFSSDRSGTLNLHYYDTKSGETKAITQYEEFDVRWPSHGGDKIVFELGGELHVLDTKNEQVVQIDITVPSDLIATRSRRTKATPAGSSLSPGGKRVAFVGRGDLFSVPAKKGVTINLTHSSNAHDREPAWSPDGKQIAFISDKSGEEELYIVDHRGREEPIRLTANGSCRRMGPRWSPDSKRLVIGDKEGRLSVVEVDSKEVTEVADDDGGAISDYSWSPDSRYLALSMSTDNEMRSIYIWDSSDKQLRRITDYLFNEFEPVWDPKGKYLYYLSDRTYAPQIGGNEWNYVTDRTTGIFAVALQKDAPHPFPPEDDQLDDKDDLDEKKEDDSKEEEDEEEQEEDDEPDANEEDDDRSEAETKSKPTKNKDKEKSMVPITIDFDGLNERVAKVPVEADNLSSLEAIEGHLLYVTTGAFFYGRESDITTDLYIFSLEDRKESVLAEDIGGYGLSPDGEKVLYVSEGKYLVADAKPESKGEGVDTSGMMVEINPREEWRQIFDEVWRRFRDYFYVENMHGVDWQAIRDQYEPLLDDVAHRSDLNYVIGEMIGELNVGHAYKAGGDYEQPARPKVALPGAILKLDPESNRYRFETILHGQNEESRYRAPLTEIGVDIQAGEFLLAIDGQPLSATSNPYRELRFKSDRPIRLLVNDEPTNDGAREVTIQPVDEEHSLIYLNWVLGNQRRVDEATKGEIGYLHLPDMGDKGISEFIKWFYGQVRKKGLIVDVRSNGGGNVSQMIIERLRRTLLATGFERNSERASTYPSVVFQGHLVCLLDEDSASDGDIFPAMFRQAKLGPLIGKRSWGGVIGITNRGTLIDGGTVFVPEFGFASTDGKWIIEGYGVDPDIEVDNDPKSLIEGRDPQLERAIEEIKRTVNEKPKTLPNRPAAPDKSK